MSSRTPLAVSIVSRNARTSATTAATGARAASFPSSVASRGSRSGTPSAASLAAPARASPSRRRASSSSSGRTSIPLSSNASPYSWPIAATMPRRRCTLATSAAEVEPAQTTTNHMAARRRMMTVSPTRAKREGALRDPGARVVLDPRALRIGRVGASRQEERHGPTSPAAAPEIRAAPARLLGLRDVVAERRVGRRRRPLPGKVEEIITVARIERARRRRAALIDAHERQTTDAARDLEQLHPLGVRCVAGDEGRRRAVELHRDAVTAGELECERKEPLPLLARETLFEVALAGATGRLQPQQLHLDQAGRRRPGHHVVERVEVGARDHHVGAHPRTRRDQKARRPHAAARLVDAENPRRRQRVDRYVDL